MKFKCVDELDKFGFSESEVRSCTCTEECLKLELDGVIAKYNNPCNQRYQDFFIATTQVRLVKPEITKVFLEGRRLFDANDVLLKEIPDVEIEKNQYGEIFRKLTDGIVFMLREQAEQATGQRSCEIAVDVGDDTYWLEVCFEKSVAEWDRFVAKVE